MAYVLILTYTAPTAGSGSDALLLENGLDYLLLEDGSHLLIE